MVKFQLQVVSFANHALSRRLADNPRRMELLKPFGNRFHVKVLDFPYDYTHEKPLPLFDIRKSGEVDAGFEKVFIPACRILE